MPTPEIPDASTLVRAGYEHRLTVESDIRGHLQYLHDTVLEQPACGHVIELGVRSGVSTSALLSAVQIRQYGCLVSIDIEMPTSPPLWAYHTQWHFLQGDDLDPAIVAKAAVYFPEGINVLFIDTIHTYEHTLAELRTYGPMVRPGGKILLHDTLHDIPFEPKWPVSKAIREWCAETGYQWVNRTGYHGLGVITIS